MKLELCNVTRRYGTRTALRSVSLTLEPGIYGLLGPNGAGKSTLMNLITCNLRPDEGSIHWNGTEIRSLGAEYRAVLGYAPQQQGMYESFTGRRFIAYMAALKGIPKSRLSEEISRVLAAVNLTEVADRPIGSYSGGMKQRILLAQAILGDPQLLILDEPTAGLDPKERVRIRERISELAGDRIILVSTHVVSDIESIAREILLIRAGEIADRGSVPDLCQKYHVTGLEEVYLQLFGEEESDAPTDRL